MPVAGCALAEHNQRIRERQAAQQHSLQDGTRAARPARNAQRAEVRAPQSSGTIGSSDPVTPSVVQRTDQEQQQASSRSSGIETTDPVDLPNEFVTEQEAVVALRDVADTPFDATVVSGPPGEPGIEVHTWTSTMERITAIEDLSEFGGEPSVTRHQRMLDTLGFRFVRVPLDRVIDLQRRVYPVSPRHRQFMYPSTRWSEVLEAKHTSKSDDSHVRLIPRLLVRNWQTRDIGAAPSLTAEVLFQYVNTEDRPGVIRSIVSPESSGPETEGQVAGALLDELNPLYAYVLIPHTELAAQNPESYAARGFIGQSAGEPVGTIVVFVPRVYQPYKILQSR